jgi:cellulose synthase/poly-beta-1,6-N-acetylglucosamine synthase-like glycosyltransferase
MLMCAYNEEQVIEAKVQNLLSLRESDPDLEILVYVDCGTDRTAQILSKYRDRIRVHVASERHGKTRGMNVLAGMTKAELLIFTDANVMVAADLLDRVRAHFEDPSVGCIAGHIEFTNSGESVTAASGSLYWHYEEWVKRLEGDTGSVMGATGGLFAIRAGLHESPPDHIIDDMYVSFMTLCQGYRIVQANDVLGYEESVSSINEEFRRKIRIACQAFNAHKLIWPRLRQTGVLNAYKYLSHKYLRWLTIYFLAAAVLLVELSLALTGYPLAAAALLILGACAMFAGYRFKLKPLAQIVDILSAFLGTGLGVSRSIRGELFQTWTPAASIRKS